MMMMLLLLTLGWMQMIGSQPQRIYSQQPYTSQSQPSIYRSGTNIHTINVPPPQEKRDAHGNRLLVS
eukprot:3409696-Rhodomonas_salina.4